MGYADRLFDLTDRVVLVTGGSRGLGREMPGPFLTDISAAWNLDDAGGANPFAGHALQRAGDPAEIVGAALFLMSDASSFTTGAILHADGGFA
jgi:NAD(P)-dependent dehydrogenase (short-subunit alcohol dehydrogenase family)